MFRFHREQREAGDSLEGDKVDNPARVDGKCDSRAFQGGGSGEWREGGAKEGTRGAPSEARRMNRRLGTPLSRQNAASRSEI